jgi:hypothetical protein
MKCPVCKRVVSVDGTRISTHGPGLKRADFICPGSNANTAGTNGKRKAR